MADKKETPETKITKDFKSTGLSRKHGFQRPFNFYQVLSWLIFAFDILFFYFLYIPMFNMGIQVMCSKAIVLISSFIDCILHYIWGFWTIDFILWI